MPRPIQAVIVPVPGSATEPAHEHADLRYLLATERPELGSSEPDAPLRWLRVEEALDEVTEENLRELLRRAARTL